MKTLTLPLAALLVAPTTFANEPSGYKSLGANEKLETLWDRASQRPYRRLPNRLPGFLSVLRSLTSRYLAEAFNRESDFRRADYPRVIHPFGTMAPVDFEVTRDAGQSGLLKSGGQGLLRFSLATPDQFFLPYVPGLALKFPVSEKSSVDFQAMFSLDGRSNRDFFELPFRTFIPRPENPLLLPLFKLFKRALGQVENGPDSPTQLMIRESETLHQDGTAVAASQAHRNYAVSFAASDRLKGLLSNVNWRGDFRRILARHVPTGTHLMDVYLYRREGDQPVKIGLLRTRAEFVASEFVDKGILFRHQKNRARR